MSTHTQAHTPTHACTHNTAVVFLIQRGQSCGNRVSAQWQGTMVLVTAGRTQKHTRARTHTHAETLIAREEGLTYIRLRPPVPLIKFKSVASGTHGTQCQQINTRRQPHINGLTRAWSVTTTCKNAVTPLRTNLR